MALPEDFDATYAELLGLRYDDADPVELRQRLVLSVSQVAKESDVKMGLLGPKEIKDKASEIVAECEIKLRSIFCEDGELRKEYDQVSIYTIAGSVSKVLATHGDSYALSTSVVAFFTLWLTRMGLRSWCKTKE